MTALLRFLFVRRFNRLDLLGCSVAAVAFALGSWMTALVIIAVFALVSATGEHWLERRS